jgi:hypothetical protein
MLPRAQVVDAAALIAQLQEHSHDPDEQAQCCSALSREQLSDDSALSFFPAIVAALRAHPGHARLQTSGFLTLAFICQGRSADALAGAAGAADGIHAAVDALRAHADAHLQCAACGLLSNLAASGVLRETAV